MAPLMSYMAAFGLATGAGAKAFIPLFALGAFHYTSLFELSERWQWIADPVVMAVFAVLIVVEIVVDAHPELGRFADLAAYLPKFVAGFIAFAAATGEVDGSLVSLGASGVLGGGTASGVHWLRNQIRRPFRDAAEHLHDAVGKTASLAEAGTSVTVSGAALVAPPLALVAALVLAAAALAVTRRVDRRRVPCVHCASPIRPGAAVCVHCGRMQHQVDIPHEAPSTTAQH